MSEDAPLLMLSQVPRLVAYSRRSAAPLERCASRPGWLERVLRVLSTAQAS